MVVTVFNDIMNLKLVKEPKTEYSSQNLPKTHFPWFIYAGVYLVANSCASSESFSIWL